MFPGTNIFAQALTGISFVAPLHAADRHVSAVTLPSDSLRMIHVITLSQFDVIPGPQFEGVFHGALFRSTEHLYDL